MFKKLTKKTTPVVQEQVGRKPYFDVITEDDMKRESEGKEKFYSHEGSEAKMSEFGYYQCYYQEGETLWSCYTVEAPTGTQPVQSLARIFMKGSDHQDVAKFVPCRGDNVMWKRY